MCYGVGGKSGCDETIQNGKDPPRTRRMGSAVRAMILEAVADRSVAVANSLFQCTEAAKVRVDWNEKKDITFRVDQGLQREATRAGNHA